MTYSNLPIGTNNPGFVLFLVDQSKSMSEAFAEERTRAEIAADAINGCIYEIICACMSGVSVKDRCHIGVIGYGGDYGQDQDGRRTQAKILLGGTVSEIHARQARVRSVRKQTLTLTGARIEVEQEMPVWIEPAADHDTPMAAAFDEASELISLWIAENPHNFPPLVINITDGEPTDEGKVDFEPATAAAQRLMRLKTSDGCVLLLNAHIDPSLGEEILLPSSEPTEPCARFLYSISSELPPLLREAARAKNFSVEFGARGCVFNARAESLIGLIVFGSTPAVRR